MSNPPVPLMALYGRYLEAVRSALKQRPEEWVFKSNPGYRDVLEHTPREFADAMLVWSLKALPELDIGHVRRLCRRNDSLGKPVQDSVGGLGLYAPSNMRYLCHAIKVWQHIESLKLPSVDIVELGGGYGGLALWIYGLADLFRTKLDVYAMLDLPEVAMLQNKVCQATGTSAFTLDGTDPVALEVFTEPRPWFCISAYAFSEFDQPTRDWYAERLLKYCRHGLMVWNFPEAIHLPDGQIFGGPPYQFVEWPITRTPDVPALYNGHEVVTW